MNITGWQKCLLCFFGCGKAGTITKLHSYEGQMAIFIKIINVFTMEHAVSFLGIDTHLCKMECLQDYSLQHLDSS